MNRIFCAKNNLNVVPPKMYLHSFLILLWVSIIGMVVTKYWFPPQLPRHVLLNLQNNPQPIFAYLEYILFAGLFVASIGLYLCKNLGKIILISSVLFWCIFLPLKTFEVAFLDGLFKNMMVLSLGIIIGICFSNPMNLILGNKTSEINWIIFRFIVITTCVSNILCFVAIAKTDNNLPPLLVNYLHSIEIKNPLYQSLGLISYLLLVISLFNLLFRSKIAKYLFTITIFLVYFFFNQDPVAETGWDDFIGTITLMLEGCLLALLYIAPISKEFSQLKGLVSKLR